MKTLKNHTIIYDDECPMCDLYTNAFVRTGMLEPGGRVPFGNLDQELLSLIDRDRSCNEIALVDMAQGRVTYGVESIFAIIGNRFPWMERLFRFAAFRWAMKKLYSFISYNRKAIVPGKVFEKPESCIPSFHLKYRWAYIIFAWLITAPVLAAYSTRLYPLIPPSTMLREFLICGGQIVFQFITVSLVRKERVIHYLGNMMTVSLLGAMLLLPALLLPLAGIDSAFVYAAWFLAVVGIMLLEHLRRVRILGMSLAVSAAWVFYRLAILLLII